mmetsp:Transcript_9288/g.23088  ORF Transcript_9288/g.23088 Transcript_9288/m.23088 type:complete len:90 (-) Transcript_9288:257-526(-)
MSRPLSWRKETGERMPPSNGGLWEEHVGRNQHRDYSLWLPVSFQLERMLLEKSDYCSARSTLLQMDDARVLSEGRDMEESRAYEYGLIY